jgi:hypothetical protein
MSQHVAHRGSDPHMIPVIDRAAGGVLAVSSLSGEEAKITARSAVRAVFQGLSGRAIRHIANETMEISAGYQADRSGMCLAYGYELRELSDVLMALADVMEAGDA